MTEQRRRWLRKYKREWNRRNRGRYAAQEAKWRRKNRKRLDHARHKRNLRKLYGMTVEEYDARMTAQRHRCAICRRHQSEVTRRFHVDHNHKTGKIRGLLCGNCNSGIGNLRDSPRLLKKAAEYLRSKP